MTVFEIWWSRVRAWLANLFVARSVWWVESVWGEAALGKQGRMWVTIGNASVYLGHHDEGLTVDVYRLGDEMGEALVSTWLMFDEVEQWGEEE